jgi:sarcosine oxidase
MGYDTIVVGAGIFGLSTANELANRGQSVLLIDRFGSGHPATSSTGASRSIRVAYDHPFYVELAQEAIESWHRLERASGKKILHLTGQVDLGDESKLRDLVRTVHAAGAEIEVLDAGAVRRYFPELVLAAGEIALFQKQAGTVLADVAMTALLKAAQNAGVVYVAPERAMQIDFGPVVTVHTDRQHHEASQVVVAAGPWAKELLSGIGIDLPLSPAVAQVTFLDAPGLVERPGIAEWSPNGGAGYYGHPVPGIGYKIAYDAGMSGWHPDVEEWGTVPEEERQLLQWLGKRMPGVPHKITKTQRHPWTMTPDVDFIVDRKDRLIVAGGCSGHAFKFGPALGRMVADIVEGGAAPQLTRLDRPALARAAPSPSLPISR